MKTCFKCGASKPINEFYKHPQMADGHLNKCKECAKKDSHESRHVKHRERVLQYDRLRAKTAKRINKAKAYSSVYRRNNKDKIRAQRILRRAVISGRISPLPCFICGEKAVAHHPDYSAPLAISWLCHAHHKQAHAIAF